LTIREKKKKKKKKKKRWTRRRRRGRWCIPILGILTLTPPYLHARTGKQSPAQIPSQIHRTGNE